MDIILQKAKDYGWLLCIFFSVDIEGATAYKADRHNRNEDEDWCLLFEQFYEEFPLALDCNYLPFSEKQISPAILQITRPTLWKFVGDEILFYAPLTAPSQTLEHVRAFQQTIISYNKDTLKKYGVQCKGTAWLAGFPINNRIVLIRDKSVLPIIDFVGMSIDTGFRLTKFASPRKLIVSLDLLWLLAESRKNNSFYTFLDNKIKYVGKQELKGVLSGKPYPIFWIDSYTESPIEDKFLLDQKTCEPDDIIKFCKELSGSIRSSAFVKPFIVGDNSDQIKEERIRQDFKQQHASLLKYKKQTDVLDKNADSLLKEKSYDPSIDDVTVLNKLK
jgi:hypothetical protein